MVEKRTGDYGVYWTTPKYKKSEPLSDKRCEDNVKYIYSYLHDHGWATISIAAVLGNMANESSFNPGAIQGYVAYIDSYKIAHRDSRGKLYGQKGISLVQWTIAGKETMNRYLKWLDAQKNITNKDFTIMDNALARLDAEMKHNLDGVWSKSKGGMTCQQFYQNSLNKSIDYLATSFKNGYEKNQSQDPTERIKAAKKWYNYINKTPIPTPSQPHPTKKLKPFIRDKMPEVNEDGYLYYVTAGSGGYSSCIPGSPLYRPLNVLQNCVGLAWGAFNETFVKTNKKNGNNIKDREYYRPSGNADKIIDKLKTYRGGISGKDMLVTLTADQRPPLGGLIVWSTCHVAYISEVIDDDTIVVQQSGYGSGPTWLWRHDTYKRNQNGENHWGYTSGGKCLGFVVNPAVAEDYQPVTVEGVDSPPQITSVENVSATSVRVKGKMNAISGVTKKVILYYKWSDAKSTISETDYDGYVEVTKEDFAVIIKDKPRSATVITILPMQINISGSDIGGGEFIQDKLIESYPCIRVTNSNNKVVDAIPYVYTNNEWKMCIPVISTNGGRYAVYNTDYEKV